MKFGSLVFAIIRPENSLKVMVLRPSIIYSVPIVKISSLSKIKV